MTPPRRRWFRYSLRTLFVLVTVLASSLSLAMAYPDAAAFVVVMLVVTAAVAAQLMLPSWLSRRR